jgi:sugar/nucleoside kinase (ribokinase family)
VRSNTPKLLQFIDVAVVAERFCEQMQLTPADTLDYLESRGCRVVGVTLGEHGFLWRERGKPTRAEQPLRIPPARVIDTSGAGDVFHGAYVYSYLTGPAKPWAEHFRFARAAAAHKIQHLGNEAGLPSLADIAAVEREFESTALTA